MSGLTNCLGCGLLVSPGPRCSRCQRSWERDYDHTRPEFHTLYQTSAWKRLSAEVREGATRCHWCLRPTRRLVADHVIPLDRRPDLALERSNLVPACFPCNTRRGRNAKLPDLADPHPGGGEALGSTPFHYTQPTPQTGPTSRVLDRARSA